MKQKFEKALQVIPEWEKGYISTDALYNTFAKATSLINKQPKSELTSKPELTKEHRAYLRKIGKDYLSQLDGEVGKFKKYFIRVFYDQVRPSFVSFRINLDFFNQNKHILGEQESREHAVQLLYSLEGFYDLCSSLKSFFDGNLHIIYRMVRIYYKLFMANDIIDLKALEDLNNTVLYNRCSQEMKELDLMKENSRNAYYAK